MSGSVLITNGRILDPSQKMDLQGDLFICDGVIQKIESSLSQEKADRVIDAKGKWILPGFIDAHVHLREPGLEYKETIETGTRAAVAGGFTSVACMANTQPVNDSPYVTAFIRERAKSTAVCRVFPIGAVTKGLKGEELSEIGGMIEEGAVAISDDGMPVMNSYLMRKAMDYSKAFDIPVISHSEDLNLVGKGVMNEGPLSNELGLRGNPTAAEEIMVAREVALCRLTGARVHIAHVSTALAVDHIRRAKKEGLPLTAEVTPHHLTLTEEAVRTYNTCCKMAPPLRTQKDIEALQAALADGTIDMIATDHAPHGISDKACPFDQADFGITGLQTVVPMTYQFVRNGTLALDRWIDSLTHAPARLLKLPHGSLKVGSAADVTLFDPEAKWTLTENEIQSKSKNTPHLGEELTGKISTTVVNGEVVYER